MSSEDIPTMSIYKKIMNIRSELMKRDIKKSGHSNFGGFDYFELDDLIPPIQELCEKYNLFLLFSFRKDEAILTALNIDNTGEIIETNSPMPSYDNPLNSKMNLVQTVGTYETYQRRYLYIALFDITEKDAAELDKKESSNNKKTNKKDKNNSNEFKEDTEAIKLLNDLKAILLDPKDPQDITKNNILKLAKELNNENDNNFNIDTKLFSRLRKQITKEGIK